MPDPDEVTEAALLAYMKQYRPEKADRVQKILKNYAGRHGDLRKDLKAKYGAEPARSGGMSSMFQASKRSAAAPKSTRFASSSKRQTPLPDSQYADYGDASETVEHEMIAGHKEDDGFKGYKPSHDEAARHRRNHILPQWVFDPVTTKKRRAAVGEHGYIYPVMSTPTNELMHFGLGVGLYFRLLLDLGALLVIVALINSISIHYFASSAYKGANGLEHDIGSAACVATPVEVGDGVTVDHNSCQLEEEQGVLNMLSIFIFFIYVVASRQYYGWLEKAADEEVQTAQDYSVVVENPGGKLPPNTDVDTALKMFKAYFEHVGGSDSDVAFITVAVDNRKLLAHMAAFMDLREQYKMATGKDLELENEYGPIPAVEPGCCTGVCPAWLTKMQEEACDSLAALCGCGGGRSEEQWMRKFGLLKAQIRRELEACDGSDGGFDITKVYVTYMKEGSQRRCLERLVNSPNEFKFQVDRNGQLVTAATERCHELKVPAGVDRGSDMPSWEDSIPVSPRSRWSKKSKEGDDDAAAEATTKAVVVTASRPIIGDSVLVDTDGKVLFERKNGKLLSDGVEVTSATTLKVTEACEPSDVFWERLGQSSFGATLKSMTRKFVSLVLCGLFIWLSTICIDNVNQSSASPQPVALLISFFNFMLPWVMKVVSSFEEHSTHSSLQSSLVIKLLAVRCINSAFINFHLTKYEDTLSVDSLHRIQSILVFDMLFTPLLHFLDPVGVLKRVVLSRFASTQNRLNHLYAGTNWDLADRYTDMIKTLFVAMFYSVLMPHGLWLAALSMLTTYWADKYCLLRCWSQKPDYDTFITKIAQNSIAFCMLVQLFMATYWISGYPFDRACRVDSTDAHHRRLGADAADAHHHHHHADAAAAAGAGAGAGSYQWEECDRLGGSHYDDPMEWIFPEQRDDMTTVQRHMVSYYSVINLTMLIVVFVTLYFADVYRWIRERLFGYYSNKTREFNDDYNQVPHIRAYVPMVQKAGWETPMLACPLHPMIQDREKIWFDVEYSSSYEERSVFDALLDMVESDPQYFGTERRKPGALNKYFSVCKQYCTNLVHKEVSTKNDASAVWSGAYGGGDRFEGEKEALAKPNPNADPFKRAKKGKPTLGQQFVDYMSHHACLAVLGFLVLVGVFIVGCLAVAYQHLCDHPKQMAQDGLCAAGYCTANDQIADASTVDSIKLVDLLSAEGKVTVNPAWAAKQAPAAVSLVASMYAREAGRANGLVKFNSSSAGGGAGASSAIEANADFGTVQTKLGYDVDCKHVDMAVEFPPAQSSFGKLEVTLGHASSIEVDMGTTAPASASADGSGDDDGGDQTSEAPADVTTSVGTASLSTEAGTVSVRNYHTTAHGSLTVQTERSGAAGGGAQGATASLFNVEAKVTSVSTRAGDVSATSVRVKNGGQFNVTTQSGTVVVADIASKGNEGGIWIESDTGDILVTVSGRHFHGKYNLQSRDGQVWTDEGAFLVYPGGANAGKWKDGCSSEHSWQGMPTLREEVHFEHDHCKQGRVGFAYGKQTIVAYSRTGNVTLRVR